MHSPAPKTALREKILLVDDVPANLGVLSSTLEAENYEVLVAPNGSTALKLAAKAQPSLILLDVLMPGWDGVETCRQLKALQETRDIPVIFITARNETNDIVAGFACWRSRLHYQTVSSRRGSYPRRYPPDHQSTQPAAG